MDVKTYFAKKARYYDMINAFKFRETDEELRFYTGIMRKFGKKVRTILDVGCGTGRQAIPLSEMGFKVVGIDNSSEMLAVARKKIKKSNRNIRLELADMRTYAPGEKFDCALCGDASLAVFVRRAELVRVLRNICGNLRDGGMFFYDIWNYADFKDWHHMDAWTEEKDGTEISIARRAKVNPRGIYRFDDVIRIRRGGKSHVLKTSYRSKVWKRKEWSGIFREAGFRRVTGYSNLEHVKHYEGVPDRVYFVALK